MEKITLNVEVFQYENLKELDEKDRELVEAAKSAAKSAYAPYSHFHVGAAVRLDDGKIITGTNQENSAYPSGLCAERVALFAANSQYPDNAVEAIAICSYKDGNYNEIPTPPCGSCRQVMIETEVRFDKPMKVILYGRKKIMIINNAKSLLPLSFTADDL